MASSAGYAVCDGSVSPAAGLVRRTRPIRHEENPVTGSRETPIRQRGARAHHGWRSCSPSCSWWRGGRSDRRDNSSTAYRRRRRRWRWQRLRRESATGSPSTPRSARTAPTTRTGVSGNTITIGYELPAVGHYAPFADVLDGEPGVHRLHSTDQGRRHGRRQEVQDRARGQGRRLHGGEDVTNAQSLVNDDKVFGCSTWSAPRTTSRSATSDQQCVPDLFAATGHGAVGQPRSTRG